MLNSNDANIKAVITADDKASAVLKNFADKTHGVAGKITSGLALTAKSLTIATGAAVAFGAISVKAFTESQDLIAQTNAVLKSTGRVAGVTADQVTKLATALEKQTKFSDEDVRSVENLLLTFTSIGKDIFPQATKTVLDMATALGEDTKSASIQLGKALQDPVLGITALRRVGVNFNEAQKDVIAKLVETGHKAEAQRLILKELHTEFGGSAVAAGTTFAGSLEKLKNQLNNVQEKLGEVIAKYIAPFITKALEAVAAIDWDSVIGHTVTALRNFIQSLGEVTNKIKAVFDQVSAYLLPKLQVLWNTLETQLIPALVKFWRQVIEPLIPVIGTILVGAIGAVIDALNFLLRVLTPVINFLSANKEIVYAFAGAFIFLRAALFLSGAVKAFTAAMSAIRVQMAITSGSVKGLWALIAGGTVMGSIVVAGALADIALVARAVRTVIGAINAMNDAKRQIAINDASNQAEISGLRAMAVAGKTQAQRTSARNTLHMLGVPGYAMGTNFAPGGMAIVGERGPELVNLPRGSQVTPNNKVGGANINISINAGAFMGSDTEARKFAQIILMHMKDLGGKNNMSVAQLLGM